MKRRIAMLLALVMCFALSACGGNNEPPAAEEPVPMEVVEAIPEPAAEPTPEPTPAPTATPEPEIIEIEITPDNWEEYFEIAFTDSLAEDGFGTLWNVTRNYRIALREEYRDRADLSRDWLVMFAYDYNEFSVYCESYEAFEEGEYLSDPEYDRTGSGYCSVGAQGGWIPDVNGVEGSGFIGQASGAREDEDYYLFHLYDVFYMTRVEGSLYLYE